MRLPKSVRNFYRLRLSTGVLIAMPALLLWLWSISVAQNSLTAFRRLSGEETALDAGLYQIRLHDLASQQLKSGAVTALASAQAAPAELPTFAFQIKNERLIEMLNPRRQPYVEGKLDYRGQRYKQTELRLRGSKHWHLLEAKKSLRVKLDKGKLIDGQREFNLNNSNDTVLFGPKLIFDIARQRGLLTTEADFAKVSINGLPLGVYTLSTPVDEMILRRARQIPANVYALDKLSADWRQAGRWEKLTAYQNKDSEAVLSSERADLSRLITMLQADDVTFSRFAHEELALKEFATLDALQLLFGSDDKQRGYALSYDPYRGLWRPIASEFEGFRSEKPEASQDPLFVKLAAMPDYLRLRSELLTELMRAEAAPDKIRGQGQALMARLLPDLEQDPNWKANRQLPAINGLYSQLMRPMSAERLELAFDSEMETYARRLARLEPFVNPSASRLRPVTEAVAEQVILGPGRIDVPVTRVFEPHQQVKVLPGTTFALSQGASLVFRGQVNFAGTAAEPIKMQPATEARWGGLVLQGQATAGSRLSHLQATHGTHPSWRAYQYPGMINLHDSHDIQLEAVYFSDNAGSDDLLHSAYITGLHARDVRLEKAHADAWDIEFSSGRLERVFAAEAGDDGIDLMASQLEIVDSALLGCAGNGISAGEESQIHVLSSLIADTGVGALAKNASHLSFTRSLLYRNQAGLEIYQKSPNYTGLSQIEAESLFAAGQQTPLILDEDSRRLVTLPVLAVGYQRAHSLEPLRRALGIKSWSELSAWISLRRREARL